MSLKATLIGIGAALALGISNLTAGATPAQPDALKAVADTQSNVLLARHGGGFGGGGFGHGGFGHGGFGHGGLGHGGFGHFYGGHHDRDNFFVGVPYDGYAYGPSCWWSYRWQDWVCDYY